MRLCGVSEDDPYPRERWNGSFVWNGIVAVTETLVRGSQYIVRDGSTIDIRSSKWVPGIDMPLNQVEERILKGI